MTLIQYSSFTRCPLMCLYYPVDGWAYLDVMECVGASWGYFWIFSRRLKESNVSWMSFSR